MGYFVYYFVLVIDWLVDYDIKLEDVMIIGGMLVMWIYCLVSLVLIGGFLVNELLWVVG